MDHSRGKRREAAVIGQAGPTNEPCPVREYRSALLLSHARRPHRRRKQRRGSDRCAMSWMTSQATGFGSLRGMATQYKMTAHQIGAGTLRPRGGGHEKG